MLKSSFDHRSTFPLFDAHRISKGGNVDLSKWSKDDFSSGLISDYIDCKYFAGKPMAPKNFGFCFAAKENFIDTFWRPNFSIW